MKIFAHSLLCLSFLAFFTRNAAATIITTQPANAAIACGDNAVFTVAASGGPLLYQWQNNGANIFDGSNVSGSSSAAVTLRNATGGGSYTVIVTDANGSVTSSVVTVSITNDFAPPVIYVTGAGTVFPMGTMVKGADGNFYGTTRQGGAYDMGWIFKTTTGGVVTILHEFTGGLDGGNPQAGLTLGPDGIFYGTTYLGGTNNLGTFFKVSTNGFTNLYSFKGGFSGSRPQAILVLGPNGNFYGTTDYDGAGNSGTAFMITPAGVFTSLHAFNIGVDGNGPQAPLILGNDGKFYGTTYSSIYKMTTNGIVTPLVLLNNGEGPIAGLVQGADGKFYGTTHHRGLYDFGFVFSMTTNGVTNLLYTFTGGADGGNPDAEMVQAANGLLYGTTDGENGSSTVFSITTNGALTTLHSFVGTPEGKNSHAGLAIGADGNFYGSTTLGGAYNGGTLFSITPAGGLATLYSFNGNGQDTVECHGAFTDAGAMASDACAGNLTLTTNGIVDPQTPGDYLLQYTATDASGNSATNARVVHVQDTALPVVTLNTVTNVVFWGDNGAGESNIVSVTNAVAVSGGFDHALALTSSGLVIGFGGDNYGQIDIPPGLFNVTAIAAGTSFSLALKSDGTVAAWGADSFGQSEVPVGLTGVAKIAAGTYHSLALKSNGTVVVWGGSPSYGVNTLPSSATNGVMAIAAGYEFSVALRIDGTVVAWGIDTAGQTDVPANATNIIAIAAGSDYVLALKNNGTVIGWGNDGTGQTDIPVGLTGVTAISAGTSHNLALKANGSMVGWGTDYYGETEVPFGLNNVTSFAACYYYSVAVQVFGGNSLTVECHSAFIDPGATASDACAGNFAATVGYPFGPLDVNTVGTYSITYGASDPSGNASSAAYRVVNVIDTTPPVITLNGTAQDYAGLNITYVDPGATASDLCGGSGIAVTRTGTLTTATLGDYTLTYTAMDSSGNSASVLRTVSVIDAAPPVITQQPFNLAVNTGDNATFRATATGHPLAYQWYKDSFPLSDGGNITGATTGTLSLTGVQSYQAGNYLLTVSNPLGVATSSIVNLTVYGVVQSGSASLNAFNSPQATAIGIAGNRIYVSGRTTNFDGDGFLAQYDLGFATEAHPIWSTAWPMQSGFDAINALVTPSTNEFYFAGSSYSLTHDSSGAKEVKGIVVKFPGTGPGANAQGNGAIWSAQEPPSPGAFTYSGSETINGLAPSAATNTPFLYATGSGQNSAASPGRFFLTKLDTNGASLWTRNDVTPGLSSAAYSVGAGVAVFNDNVYAVGRTEDSGVSKAFIRKYDAQGNLLWSYAQTPGQFTAVAVHDGSIYAVGSTALDGTADFLVEKRDETGQLLWSRTFDNTTGPDFLNACTFLNDRLYAVGSTKGPGTDSFTKAAPALLELDLAAGDYISLTTWGNGGFGSDQIARGVAVDGSNLYIVTDSSGGLIGGGVNLYRFTVTRESVDMFLVSHGVPAGLTGQPYQTSFDVIGGIPPYTWTASLPAGLTISSNGVVSGIPTSAGVSGAGVQVTDSGASVGQDVENDSYNFIINIFDSSPTTLSFSTPTNGSVSVAPGSFTLFAGSSGENIATSISFFSGNNLLQTSAGSSASYPISGLSAGSYAFNVTATNVFGLSITSAVHHVTVEDANTSLIDFEALDTSVGEVTAVPLTAYLSRYGVSAVGSVTAGSHLAVRKDASGNNFLSQYGLNGPVSYTLSFASTHASISWTRLLIPAGTFQPAWTAHAFDGSGNELGSTGEPQINGASDTSAQMFTLYGPAIASVRFDADNHNLGSATSLAFDNLLLNDNPIGNLPNIALTSPVDGSSVVAPGPVTITADGSPGDNGLVRIDLYSGNTLIATRNDVPTSFTLNNLAPGTYTFHAVATDFIGASRNSTPVTITVTAAAGVNVVNFDALDASAGNLSGTALSNYLAAYGITLTNVTVGAAVQVEDGKNVSSVTPSSPANFLTQSGGSGPVTFTLNFAAPLNNVAFTRIALRAGASHPHWIATAFDAAGNQLTSIGEDLITASSDVPAATFNLTASGISSIRFDSDSQHVAGFTALLLDDLVLNATAVVNPLSIALTSPAEAATFTAPANIPITVAAADTLDSITQVIFYSGPNIIGRATDSPYNFTWNNVLAGTYTLTAAIQGSSGTILYSAPVHVTVNPGTTGGTVVNFDSLNATTAPVTGLTLSNYLATYGITLVSNSLSTNTTLAVKDQRTINGGASVAASSPYNVLTQTGSNAPVSYTLQFNPPLSQFGFTRPKLLARPQAVHPAWTVTAFDSVGVPLSQTNEALISASTDVAAQSFTLAGPGIATIQFASQGTTLAAFDAMLVDDFILNIPTTNIPPAVVITNPVANAVYFTRAIIPLAARAIDADGLVTQVVYYANANLIGKSKTAPYSLKWTNNIPGQYAVTAVASDNHGATRTSPAVNVQVSQGGLALSISTQPVSLTLATGSLASFGVQAIGPASIHYQWRYNTGNIIGQTNQNLNLSSVTSGNAGTYDVVITGGSATLTSSGATLTVLDAPVITAQPASQNAAPGDTVTLAATATGSPNLIYQWSLNGARIIGATNASFTITNAQPFNSGNYQLTVANTVGLAVSTIASLAVLPGGVQVASADNFEDRLPFNPLLGAITGNNEQATAQPGEPRHAGHVAVKSIWFTWHATFTGQITLTTLGSSFDSVMAVYTGNVLNSLTPVASDDDSGGYFAAQVTFAVAAGTDYQIAVDGYRGASGNVILGLPAGQGYRVLAPDVAAALPIITAQPTNQVVQAGNDVTLTVAVTSADTVHYQWFFNDVPLAGSDASSLLVKHFSDATVGRYAVLAANDAGSVRSADANIQLGIINGSTPATTGTEDKFGDSVDLSNMFSTADKKHRKEAGGGDSRGYSLSQVFNTTGATKEPGEPNHCGQVGGCSSWYTFTAPTDGTLQVDTAGSGFNTILAVYTGPGTDFISLVEQGCGYTTNYTLNGQPHVIIPNVTSNTTYFIVVDGYQGASGSAHLRITLGAPPVIVSGPKDQPVGPASTASFNVVSTGTTNLLYQWLFNSAPIGGATNSTYSVPGVTTNSQGIYSVIVSNSIGAVTSTPPAMLSIQYTPLITSQPTNVAVSLNQAAHFYVTAAGAATLHYQWYFGALKIAKATGTSLAFTSAKWTNNGTYTVVVTNTYGSTTSTNVVLFAGDITPPTVVISAPANNSSTALALLPVRGTAADAAGIAKIVFQVNGGAFLLANGTKAWTSNVPLLPGTNLFGVKSIDLSSNQSPVLTRKFFYNYPTALTVVANGQGATKSTTGAANGALLSIGKNYTIVAYVPPGTNWIFTNWTGGPVAGPLTNMSTHSNLTFMMYSNLALVPNFIPNPFTPAAGVYNGLFNPISGVAFTNSGLLSMTLAPSSKGAFSGKVYLDGAVTAISGAFDLNGNSTKVVARKGKTALTLNLHLNLHPVDDLLTGSITAPNWFSGLVADHAVFNPSNNPATDYSGRYTAQIPLSPGAPMTAPGGYGYALITNTVGGNITFLGSLGDGTPFSQTVPVSKNGHMPLYSSLYSGKGFLMGWLTFTNNPPKAVSGNVAWLKTNSTATAFYQAGFTNVLSLTGTQYTPATTGLRLLSVTNATLTIADGDMAAPLVYSVRLLTNNTLTNIGLIPTNKLTAKFTNATGALIVTFRPTGAAVDKVGHAAAGQAQTNAAGWFQGTTHTGSILLEP